MKKLVELPDCVLRCPKATTLLLQGNVPLQRLPEKFLQGFKSLKIFYVGGTSISALPPLTEASEPRTLLLRDSICLERLPPLTALYKLEILDLCGTRITQLPVRNREIG